MASRLNNEGQSTIEFIMTFSATIGFIFLFLKMALNYTDGYMVHHATFMASRAYLTFDNERMDVNAGDQEAFVHSQKVFEKYLPTFIFPDLSKNNLKANHPDAVDYSALIGVYANFERKFSLGFIKINEPINYISESFLGREPSREEAIVQVCKAIDSVFGISSSNGECPLLVTLDDNGG